MKNLILENFEVLEMNSEETAEMNGGAWWTGPAIVVGLVISAINNFQDIREGFMDGYNGVPPRHKQVYMNIKEIKE